eukprot:4250943-Prymnesium_polylepis.2
MSSFIAATFCLSTMSSSRSTRSSWRSCGRGTGRWVLARGARCGVRHAKAAHLVGRGVGADLRLEHLRHLRNAPAACGVKPGGAGAHRMRRRWGVGSCAHLGVELPSMETWPSASLETAAQVLLLCSVTFVRDPSARTAGCAAPSSA